MSIEETAYEGERERARQALKKVADTYGQPFAWDFLRRTTGHSVLSSVESDKLKDLIAKCDAECGEKGKVRASATDAPPKRTAKAQGDSYWDEVERARKAGTEIPKFEPKLEPGSPDTEEALREAQRNNDSLRRLSES